MEDGGSADGGREDDEGVKLMESDEKRGRDGREGK
jgi:hypothetical protein